MPHNQPIAAEIVGRVEECPGIFSLSLRLTGAQEAQRYHFHPGQFNMLYVPGVGGVPISIVSDPGHPETLIHTIRDVGGVTHAIARLKVGEHVGVRGPFGRGWPLDAARGQDVLVITGGLGCAPVVAVIEYILRRRDDYGRMYIVQGVKHSADLIWRQRYRQWTRAAETEVHLAADAVEPDWPWHVGRVTALFERIEFDAQRSIAMLCGPEPMMKAGARTLRTRGMPGCTIWLSMERNMQCANGRCGHCQIGPWFTCRDGPVFCYDDIRPLLEEPGF